MTVYQPTPEEYAKYQQLNELMGGDLDSARGLEVLRQTGGDITKAVDIIFSAVSSDAEVQHVETASTSAHSSAPFTPTPLRQTAAPNVIDLTAGETEDEELQRALQISRGDTSGDIHQPQFGPSERGADANWSMVPASAVRLSDCSVRGGADGCVDKRGGDAEQRRPCAAGRAGRELSGLDDRRSSGGAEHGGPR
ncbi:hypothetical protein BD626DRAFT_484340 [Schizophyllum amplum]|uniref:UBA domain-containing protein n=1 Tax=Schizophyllum amplum TaxID=97359 RepID=A0A550CQA6_9AGAR|nr:hypothetical protein BD626DRAFT_484340 [Auriculariopsis ampla]